MNDMKYVDFDVSIEPTADGFATRVFNSPAGQASATFSAPFSDLEIENFLLRVGRSRHAVRRIESPEMASAKAFGGRLFDQVFAGEVRGCLRSSIDEASRQGMGLRVRLHLTKVPALADLPWEFLYNASMNRFLSLSVETPLVRYLELPERIRPLIVQPPLHVLMMISSPSDYPQLDVTRESAKMTEALADLEQRGLVVVERQEDATLSELQRRLRSGQYHIFHFIGHGGFDAQADDGILIMEDQENRGRRVSAQFLGTLLHDHRPLRLAVLNACEGARASRGDPFAGTAQSLVQQGIPAVIAMQFEVTDEAAICFTREFYAAIAVGYPVDAALAEARKAIFAEVSEIEWGTPVLYMRSPDGRVFEIEQVSEATRKQLQISSLVTAARTAAASNDAATALDRLKQVLALDPAHADATTLMREITQERELEDRYAAARASYDGGRWREALDGFAGVQAINRAYRDVPALIAAAGRELARAEAEADEQRKQRAAADMRHAAAVVADPGSADARHRAHAGGGADGAVGGQGKRPVHPDSRTEAARPRQVGWFFMGGALGAVAVIALLAVGGIAVAMFMANRDEGAVSDPKRQSVQPNDPKRSQQAEPTPSSPPAAAPPSVERRETPKVQAALDQPVRQRTPPPVAPAADKTDDEKRASPPAPVEKPAPAYVEDPPVVTPQLRATLEAVIRRANQAELQAYGTLNPAALSSSYTGDALQERLQIVQQLLGNLSYAVSTLHRQQFESFSLSPDGRRVEVELTETWSTNFHNVYTKLCISHWHERPVPQTVLLRQTNQGWTISERQVHSPNPPFVPCHQ